MLVTSLEKFARIVERAPKLVVADVETKGRIAGLENLLGVAIGWKNVSFYVPVNEWDAGAGILKRVASDGLVYALRQFLRSRSLVGHGLEYDREWIDAAFKIKSAWDFDTRIMWFLTDTEQTDRGHSLKTAQVKLLGWKESNDKALEQSVKALGGSLSKGDHYLAPVDLLGHYAALDAEATYELYVDRYTHLAAIDGMEFYRWIHSYQRLLARSTRRGVVVDSELLEQGSRLIKLKIADTRDSVDSICQAEIDKLQTAWLEERVKDYTNQKALAKYLTDSVRHKKFNHRSTAHKIELFHEVLGLPVLERTDTGLPKMDKATIASFDHPVARGFVELSELEKLGSMIKSYQEAITASSDGLCHFPLDVTGTVSGRLGGYKPYALNIPFDSEEATRPFSVRPGFEGVHADLRSIEPCIIAAYSKDPTLLKVHRDNLGDVYLDYALIAFPDNKELQELYNPNLPVTDELKSRFSKERKVCKIIHLAVGYTGTATTVARTLNKAGIPTSKGQAQELVRKYWELFAAVYDFNARCGQLISRQGFITNPYGRHIVVPQSYRKDTMNRLVQSTAHDTLISWVKEIQLQARKRNVPMFPLLPDIHDSTSWETPIGTGDAAQEIFESSLRTVSDRLGLPVRLSCEVKRFSTFYGLKNNE